MSLINQMLKELDARSSDVTSMSEAYGGQIRAVAKQKRIHPAWWLALALAAMLIGVLAWMLVRPPVPPQTEAASPLPLKVDFDLDLPRQRRSERTLASGDLATKVVSALPSPIATEHKSSDSASNAEPVSPSKIHASAPALPAAIEPEIVAPKLAISDRPSKEKSPNKATNIYAHYLEKSEKKKLALFLEVAERCEAQQKEQPKNPAGYYNHAYALGRYAQGISVVKALSQGIGSKVKHSLDMTIKLAPKHADALISLGAYHAEIIDKVGAMIGGLTYGAKKDEGLKFYKKALEVNPYSAIARVEYANGLIMLEGKKKMDEAVKLYQEAATCEPLDAMERLDVELAKEELED